MRFSPSHLLATLALATACEGSQPSAPPPGRVVSVKAGAERQVSLEEFCDVTANKTNKGAFRLPEVDGSLAPPPATGASWVNVWATWCKPCIEEMPMLVKWKERLDRQGINVNLQFLSVDQSVEEMEAFRKKHPRLPPSLHLKNPDDLQPWMQQLGLDQGAGLPIQVFVDARGRVRCVRAASLDENDYDMVARLLGTI